MFLSKLAVDSDSHQFRRDYADVHQLHRTIMSAFDEITEDIPARDEHGVLWRLDGTPRGFALYVQSRSQPDWSNLPQHYLTEPAHVRSLQPVLDNITAGRRLAFRLMANPTRSIHPTNTTPGQRGRGKRVALRRPDDQVNWLLRQADRHGFAIPAANDRNPDVAPTSCSTLVGRKTAERHHTITVEPVRFDGHLIVTDPETLTESLLRGIGRAKAYGCGLLSFAPARPADRAVQEEL